MGNVRKAPREFCEVHAGPSCCHGLRTRFARTLTVTSGIFHEAEPREKYLKKGLDLTGRCNDIKGMKGGA